MNDKDISCRIKRADRPCLICTGHMDLIEARPPKFNLFGGMPFVCNSEGIDCLDCPDCGFTTTIADYQYLSMCKRDRIQMNGRHRREHSVSRTSSFSRGKSSTGKSCTSCHTPMESNSWQYCPKCGNKCSTPAPEQSPARSRASRSRGNSISLEIPKDIIINEDASMVCEDLSQQDSKKTSGEQTESKSIKNTIVRTVTPPNLAGANTDYLSPVEMQY